MSGYRLGQQYAELLETIASQLAPFVENGEGYIGEDNALKRIVDGFQSTLSGGLFVHDLVRLVREFYSSPDVSALSALPDNFKDSSFIDIFTESDSLDMPRGEPPYPTGDSISEFFSFSLYEELSSGDVATGQVRQYNDKVSAPSKNSPSLAAINVKRASLTPGDRDVGITSAFLNLLPTSELSRAVPYLDITLISPIASDPRTLDRLTLFNSLDPDDRGELNEFVDRRVLLNRNADFAARPDTVLSTVGMELFTSPQTLTDANRRFVEVGPGDDSSLINPLDPFKPLVSIKSLSIDVVPSAGLRHTNKTAKLQLTLHDRARLPQLARFVKPDMFGTTELLIEYGWSHPAVDFASGEAGGSAIGNQIGALIGSARSIEKFRVTNSSFSLGDGGEVGIDLSLVSMGAEDIVATSVAEDGEVQKVLGLINDVIAAVNRVLADTRADSGGRSLEDVFGASFLGSLTNISQLISATLDEEQLTEIRRFIRANSGDAGGAPSELRENLESLIGSNRSGETGGLLSELRSTIESVMSDKRAIIERENDPFFKNVQAADGTTIVQQQDYTGVDLGQVQTYVESLDEDTSEPPSASQIGMSALGDRARRSTRFCSFGKVLLTYVGLSLVQTNKFDEVQFIFYPFNAKASFLHQHLVSQFPIDIEKLEDVIKRETQTTANIPLGRFMSIMNQEFLANQTSAAYGMATLYTTEDGETQLQESIRENQSALTSIQSHVLSLAYGEGADATFRLPSVRFHVEAVPASFESNNGLVDNPTEKTILRIHVYDEQCTRYESHGALLRAARSDQIAAVNGMLSELNSGNSEDLHVQDYLKGIEAALNSGLLESLDSSTSDPTTNRLEGLSRARYRVAGGPGQIKRFLRKNMPSFRYGTAGSGITKASLSSNNNPQMMTIGIIRSRVSDSESAPGVRDEGVPLWIAPTEVQIEMFGCPYLQVGQQFFFDFDTNTSADNIYAVNSVSHNIEPGKFMTTAKLMPPTDAYGEYRSMLDGVATAVAALNSQIGSAESGET